ncbi:MAG: binding-protein-dependent transport system inner rane component [Chloroflexi bacterium]|nr:binding-protein-dependent transport system inner rane component [Chloroflexota bacterium]
MQSQQAERLDGGKARHVALPVESRAIRAWARRWGINAGLLFILPALLIYAAVVLYPLLSMFYLSLFSWDGLSPDKSYIGLANFQQLAADPLFFVTLRNAGIWIVFDVGLSLVIGLALALLVNQRLRGTMFFRTLYFLPTTVSVIVVGQIWGWIYQGDVGALNNYLGLLGLGSLRQAWLGDPNLAIYSAVAVALWSGVGFQMMVYLAGLQTIPGEILEAAQVDGATSWQRLRTVTLPLLLPQTVTLTILGIIGTLSQFTLIYVLTKGGPAYQSELPSLFVFDQAFTLSQQGYASAIAVVIFAISLIVTVIQLRLYRRYQGY